MYGRTRTGARFLSHCHAGSACRCLHVRLYQRTTATFPASPRHRSAAPTHIAATLHVPTAHVDPALAQPCITAAANKYFLPERAHQLRSTPVRALAGGTDVDLKVDLRTAVCQLTANGSVCALLSIRRRRAQTRSQPKPQQLKAACGRSQLQPKKAKSKKK
jgi:hypothetical protein